MRKFLLALGIASALLSSPAGARHRHVSHHSSGEYYTASSGDRVHRPMASPPRPAGATARCRDGTWSFSESHRGTCSWHGGVAEWLR